MKPYPETHQLGHISLENFPSGLREVPEIPVMYGDLGIQIAKDGRIWICIDGQAFIRFSPHPDGKMMKEGPTNGINR